MEIYIVRHTTVDTPRGTIYGHADVGLAPSFEAEAAAIKATIPGEFDAVFSSPLSRCTRLMDALGQEGQLDDRLIEMGFGDWEMKTMTELGNAALKAWKKDFVMIGSPNGESFQVFYDRVISFIEELRKQDYERVLIVAHSGVLRCIWAYILEIPFKNIFNFQLDFGEIMRIELTEERDQILKVVGLR